MDSNATSLFLPDFIKQRERLSELLLLPATSSHSECHVYIMYPEVHYFAVWLCSFVFKICFPHGHISYYNHVVKHIVLINIAQDVTDSCIKNKLIHCSLQLPIFSHL